MASRVFLSSTFTDLAEHRESVQAAIRQLGANDVSMEHFGARDERPMDECVRLVREQSDLFVGIYAHRYGYIPNGGAISISEMEYKAASEASLPRFIYLVDENHPWLPVNIDQGIARKRLNSFKAELKKRHICQVFGGKDHLAAKVAADIGRHLAMRAVAQDASPIPIRPIENESSKIAAAIVPGHWNDRRNAVYGEHRRIFLTHILRPSSKPGQTFDVFIYLIRHKSDDFSDVKSADFFLGPYWENKVFSSIEENGFIGISTSAYGTFLCLCRVNFNDGTHIDLDRYIDFEAQRTGGVGI